MSLQDAPVGASYADCAVCGIDTYLRLVVGDGHIPLCGDACERAWPRVETAVGALSWLIRRIQTDPEFRYHMLHTEELGELVLANRPRHEARCVETRDRADRLTAALDTLLEEAMGTTIAQRAIDQARAILEAE